MMNSTDEKIKQLLENSSGFLKNSFRKYTLVQDMATRLTPNKALQTVYILYLMANNDEERLKINADFWLSLEDLPLSEKEIMRKEFTQSFKNLLPLTQSLRQKVEDFVDKKSQKHAA